MSWSKIFALTTAILFVFCMAMIDGAVAGEKLKWHGTSTTIEMKQMEVGDEEGHVMAITKAKQLYINEATGERTTGISVNTMDINPQMKQVSLTGSGWTVDKDGDKIMRTHEGKPVGKGHWKGTWTYIKGTGKYEGIKGTGTWESFSMAQDQPSYLEVLGEVEYPKQ
jgi:hypothetical protein